MKKYLFLVVILILTACQSSPVEVPQVNITLQTTATLSLPTETPIPAPTIPPQFASLQKQFAQSDIYTLRTDGHIEIKRQAESTQIVDGLIVNQDGSVELIYIGDERYNKQLIGKTFDIDPTSITIDDKTQTMSFEDKDGMLWKYDTKEFIPEINNNLFMAEKLFHKEWDHLTSPEFLIWVNKMEANGKFEQVSENAIPIKSIQFTPDISDPLLNKYGVAPIFNLTPEDRNNKTYLDNRDAMPYQLVSAWKTDFKGVPAYYLLVKWKNPDGTNAFVGHLHFVQGDQEVALSYEVIDAGIDSNDRIPTGNFYAKDSDVGDGCYAFTQRRMNANDTIRKEFCEWYWNNLDITLPVDMYRDWKKQSVQKDGLK